jgi:hypothetical protein
MSATNKYTEVLAGYAKKCKDTLKSVKSEYKDKLMNNSSLYAEFNTLVVKFNKYYKLPEPDGKDETKARARKMKSIYERVRGIAAKVATKNGQKEKPKSSMH